MPVFPVLFFINVSPKKPSLKIWTKKGGDFLTKERCQEITIFLK
jgi:hypothetical protein